ncbi:MAG TPA: sulfite exporter TauE/SafE family protein [Stellaceae bacterium]
MPLTSAFGTFCGIGDAPVVLGVGLALFGAGLFGGFAHCAPMCGPFVVMQLAGEAGEVYSLRRLTAGMLPGYHLGRMTTYVALGSAVGGAGRSVVQLTEFRSLLAMLLAAAALCFLLQAVKRFAPFPSAEIFQRSSEWWGRAVGRMAAPLLRRPGGSRLTGYGLGLVLGLLPCGFLYAALIAAAAAGGAAPGAVAMAAFALGTVPGLVAVGVLGGVMLRRWRRLAQAIAAPIFLLNAVTLGVLAARMIA